MQLDVTVHYFDYYAPGSWKCPKCKFTLFQKTLHGDPGEVVLKDDPNPDPCPECQTPLQRMTWKALTLDIEETLRKQCESEQPSTPSEAPHAT
jgi:hypothetical protein